MPRPFDPKRDWEALHAQIAGLGEQSSRKSYYPELQKRLQELEEEIERRKRFEEELHLKARKLEDEIAYRQRAEENASVERDNVRAIFEAAPVGMVLIDGSCRVMDANRTMEAICGKKTAEIHGYMPGQVFDCFYCFDNNHCGESSENEACSLLTMIRGVLKTRQSFSGTEIRMKRHSRGEEEEIWLKVSANPITVSGHPYAILAIDNVTDRRRMEEDLLRSHKIESLGLFAGGIAHDFNNMLASIMGNISLSLLNAEMEDVTRPLQQALLATEQATNLTRQLLTFAKGGAPVKKLASIAGIVKDSVEFVLRGANVSCDFSIPERVWAAEVDVGQLGQVIGNLAINADQAMPEGGKLHVSVENLEFRSSTDVFSAGRYVKIIISDEGVGVPKEYLTKIFDPYFTTKQSGSGLGLATVHSIITRHGGHIEVTSEPGRGTTFTLYLPASDKELAETDDATAALTKGNGRILVMDDKDFIRDMASEMLKILGYDCVTCENGHQAYVQYQQALASDLPFSAVIMDLTIPGEMGGVEAMGLIRQIDPAAVGIVASGYSSDPIVASYAQYGFSAAMPKPFTLHQMGEVLSATLTSKANTASSCGPASIP